MYTGVVFDFDGVLYDSEKHWEKIENRYLTAHIATWNPDEYKYLIGHSLPEAYAYIKKRGFELTEEEYVADYHEMADKLYSEFAKPLQNVGLLLHELETHKKKIAIASSSKRQWIDLAIQNNKLPVTITVIVSGDDPSVSKGKPAPDVYLRAAELLGERPLTLIAIEDSKNGVLSAKAAGLYCFGLRNGFNESQDLSEADEIIVGYGTANIAKVMRLVS